VPQIVVAFNHEVDASLVNDTDHAPGAPHGRRGGAGRPDLRKARGVIERPRDIPRSALGAGTYRLTLRGSGAARWPMWTRARSATTTAGNSPWTAHHEHPSRSLRFRSSSRSRACGRVRSGRALSRRQPGSQVQSMPRQPQRRRPAQRLGDVFAQTQLPAHHLDTGADTWAGQITRFISLGGICASTLQASRCGTRRRSMSFRCSRRVSTSLPA